METQYDAKSIKSKILSMILPITAENVLQMAAGTISMAFVGRINPLAVGAVGLSNILFRIIWSMFKGLGVGSSGYVAQSYGADDRKRIIFIISRGLLMVMALSLIAQQIIFWNAESLLKIFDSSPELLSSATTYLKIISWSLPLAAIILFTAGILQGMGNAKTPMIVISILNIVNIIFSYLLIFGKLGFPELGLVGAGYAYNIAHIIASGFGLYALFKNGKILKAKIREDEKEPKLREMLSLIRYGLPTSFELSFWQMASIFITRSILVYGETAYAAYQLGLQAESISYMPAAGFGVAATAFVGQAFGSKEKKLGNIYLKELQKLTMIISLVTGSIFVFFPKLVMRALTDNLEVIQIGSIYLLVMGICQLPQNLTGVYNGALRGAGFPTAPLINTGIGIWLIRVPLILFITNYFDVDIVWIWIIMALDLFSRFCISYFTLKKNKIFDE